MTIQEFENKIKSEIDENLEVRPNPNHLDIAGIYYKGQYISVSVPSNEVKEEFDKDYRDAMGNPHRNISQSLEAIQFKLGKYKQLLEEDKELFNDND